MPVPVDFYVPPPKQPSVEPVEIGLPVVVNEELTFSFKYWDRGIKKGIRHSSELYTHLHSYPASERLKAYEVAYDQAKQGIRVCITVSKTQYSVWLSLRSPLTATNSNSCLEN